MARKRKIPARKHHGVRDPLKQKQIQFEKIKDTIDNPPEKGTDQKISYKLAQFIKIRNDIKIGNKIKAKRRIDNEDKPRKESGRNIVKKKIKPIRQLIDETDEGYLRKVNRITNESLQEAEYEAKYGVEVIKNPKTGQITIKKRPKNQLTELKKNSKGKSIENKPKMAKEVIKELLKEEKKKKKQGDIQEYKKDVIKFGEVVNSPPQLLTLPRKAKKSDTVPRPGKKNNLLLRNLFKKDSSSTFPEKPNKNINSSSHAANLKGKRKDLPTATRLMIEDEQNKVVELYRQMKKNALKIKT